MHKLAIIVPYRNRENHLRAFVPYIEKYFETTQPQIEYTVYIIEQAGDSSFNRGKLLNVGFKMAQMEQNEYVCFHDVDYLPINADYSKPSKPTRLIWKGLTKHEDHNLFFGAVVLFPCDQFIKVNGYSNNYIGWGFEDTDLHFRINACGMEIDRRDQEFLALPHIESGKDTNGNWLPDVICNRDKFISIKDNIADTMKSDGLSTLTFDLIKKLDIKPNFKFFVVSI